MTTSTKSRKVPKEKTLTLKKFRESLSSGEWSSKFTHEYLADGDGDGDKGGWICCTTSLGSMSFFSTDNFDFKMLRGRIEVSYSEVYHGFGTIGFCVYDGKTRLTDPDIYEVVCDEGYNHLYVGGYAAAYIAAVEANDPDFISDA